jgi:hypothetical protein
MNMEILNRRLESTAYGRLSGETVLIGELPTCRLYEEPVPDAIMEQ